MVIGQHVATVQHVSRYCLERGADVFPYYGTPTAEEVTLFDPEVSVLCLPVPAELMSQINHPYVLWSQAQPKLEASSAVWNELESSLQEVLQRSSSA